MWQPLGIAIYFLVFAIIMVIGMFILAVFRGDFNKLLDAGINPIKDNFISIITLVLIFFVSTLFLEFLYEIGKTQVDEPSSYVFLIDDSGSMSSNDPNCERATAIKKIMEKQTTNFPYSVYKFTEKSEKLKDMSPYNSADQYTFASDGGTDIINSTNEVLDELISNNSGGSSPRIMLVSDGSSSSVGLNNIISKCNDNGISISCISFGNFFDNKLLSKIAAKTGGVYVDVDNVDDLYEEMQTAITSSATRNLISERFVLKLNWLYAILRILFLFVMALIWSLIKNISYCKTKGTNVSKSNSYENVISFTIICSIISILVMEFAVELLMLPENIARLILSILWSIIPGEFFVVSNRKANLDNSSIVIGGFQSDDTEKDILDKHETVDTDVNKLTGFSSFGAKNDGFATSGSKNAFNGFGPSSFGSEQKNNSDNTGFGSFGNNSSGSNFGDQTNGFGKNN